MAPRTSDIHVSMAAKAGNVAVAREVVSAVADVLELPEAVTTDLRLAVTEACSNVVRHAYAEGGGTMHVLMHPVDDHLDVIVEDSGRGMGTSEDIAGPGLGLSMIAVLADRLRVDTAVTGGSRVIMSFLRDRTTPSMGLA